MSGPDRAPARAPVRPRVVRDGSSLPVLLEEEIGERLAAGRPTMVTLVGASGSGKSTAISHLAAVFADHPGLRLIDGRTVLRDVPGPVTVDTARNAPKGGETLTMYPWQHDDVIEYLLATCADRVAGVLTAWDSGTPDDLYQRPGVCRAVLDVLAARPDLTHARGGLAVVLAQAFGAHLDVAMSFAAKVECRPAPRQLVPVPTELLGYRQLLSLGTVRGMLTADWMLKLALLQPHWQTKSLNWSIDTRRAIADALANDAALRRSLQQIAERPRVRHKAFVFGSLALHQRGYRPPRGLRGRLVNAPLVGIDLRNLRVRADLTGANLDDADLRGAVLDASALASASLRRARAERARFARVRANGLVAAELQAPASIWLQASLSLADLSGSNLDDADLRGANLEGTDLSHASLRRGRLARVRLWAARMHRADLEGADLSRAMIKSVDLRQVNCMSAAKLSSTQLSRCDLSGIEAAGLAAPGAIFSHCDLTAARWPGADLVHASFVGCGLADVDWQGADLRGADLRRSTFHLGNSRSGLVGSPLASEGTRTGFYTDESLEDRFQTPESVRKANLRDCDLRGATIEGVDFYLVDLRGARLDPSQREWLQRCRAILDREGEGEA